MNHLKLALFIPLFFFSIGCSYTGSLKSEKLMQTRLAVAPNTEIIINKVYIPPNVTLPKHWHPGEEFIYILDGSAIVWQKGKKDIQKTKGEVMKIDYKQVHNATGGPDGANAVIFRVHETNKSERIIVK